MEIFTFDKSLQERLEEYRDILIRDNSTLHQNILPASQVYTEWIFYIEVTIEPVGWQALWKISRSTCQDLEIHYPTIVLVEVQCIDYKELTALVKITGVQDDIHLPEKYDVPIIDLYPTTQQENNVLDIITTATSLDQLRFFYNYLWMPWDEDNDDDKDWMAEHLEPRIRLYYDMKMGAIPKKICDLIRSLIREGKDIKEKISKLEIDVSDEEDQKAQVDQEKTCQLMKYHFRLQQIKTEMEVLENPVMREILIKNQETRDNVDGVEEKKQIECYFVWPGGSLEETIESLNKTRSFLQMDTFIQTTNNLQEALDNCRLNDIIVLGNGNYDIRGASGLEEGGIIKGIGTKDLTILGPVETKSSPSLLDFSGGEIRLENVSINLGELSAGVIVRQGLAKIVNCKIFVSNLSVVKLGIIVLPGAKLFVENTTFRGLGSAIEIHKGGEATISDCTFEVCVEGVHMYDDSTLIAVKCNFCNFKESAVRLQTEKYVNSPDGKSGGLEILNNIPEVTIQDCIFANNLKKDIVLKPLATITFTNKLEPRNL